MERLADGRSIGCGSFRRRARFSTSPLPDCGPTRRKSCRRRKRRPRHRRERTAVGFWRRRETDVNHHVTAYAYLERAENALADARLDTGCLHRAGMWFRRPSRLGELMTSSCEDLDDDTLLVTLTREESYELCVTVRFRGAESRARACRALRYALPRVRRRIETLLRLHAHRPSRTRDRRPSRRHRVRTWCERQPVHARPRAGNASSLDLRFAALSWS